jgi:DNA repair photolyase
MYGPTFSYSPVYLAAALRRPLDTIRSVPFQIYRAEARSVLTATCGFIAEAGFTHSLSPARNCTFGCSYCYVPTMGIYGGLKPEDWRHWGRFTTFKTNAAELLRKSLRPDQIIYCSPLVDPYQPAEAEEALMPRVLDAVIERPPRVFVIQTRGPLILRDLSRLQALACRTCLRVSFSITTDRDDVRRLYEPLCAPVAERIAAVRRLREAGIATYATLAPILPCDPEALVEMALEATDRDIIADPFHVRAVKTSGATTREAARRISDKRDLACWHDPDFQAEILEKMRSHALLAGRRFGAGASAFAWLAEVN